MTTPKKIVDSCRRLVASEAGSDVLSFIQRYSLKDDNDLCILLDTTSSLNLKSLQNFHGLFDGALNSVINMRKLNDVKFINKFLENSNQVLAVGGFFIGNIETLETREERVLRKLFWPLNRIYYYADFLIKRVFPKFRITKKLYFFLSRGLNRVISETEIYGRLYSCGFEIVDSKSLNGKLWFVGRKVGQPDFNTEASYGLLIKLKRHGRNNELINVYKLRTMYPFSEYLQAYVMDKYGLQKGGKFKDDPRVTGAGRIFRKFWLDELPMFMNVLKGEIKIVGVRPLSSNYLSLYPEHLKEMRAKVKPGLIPPFYADLPETLEEIAASEEAYILSYLNKPLMTDLNYFWKAIYNIIVKRARSN